MIEKLVRFQIKHAKLLLLLILIIVSSSAYIAKDLQINPNFDVLIPKNSSYNTYNAMLKRAFETNDAIVLYISKDKKTIIKNIPTDMLDIKVTNYINEIIPIINQSQYVVKISNPVYSNNYNSVELFISINSPEKIGGLSDVKNQIYKLLKSTSPPAGTKTVITGLPIMMDKIPTLLISDNLNTILITLIAVFLILYWYSKDWYFTLVTIATPLISLILLAAILVILNVSVTITLAAVGVLILGLGADYAIHISIHYQKARKDHENHSKALEHTIKHLFLPISASFMTTLAGFTSLMFGVSPSSIAQGLVLALGISIIYITTIIEFPILMTVFRNKINIKENKIFDKILIGLGNLSKIQVRHSKLIIWFILLITIIMIYGASKVEFSTSNSNWIRKI